MKNVTGLDLTKLNCGAHGTLGVLTEATIKLAPKPEAEATLVMPELGESKAVEAMTRALGSPFGVSGAAWLAPGMGRAFSAHPAAPRRLRRTRSTIALGGSPR